MWSIPANTREAAIRAAHLPGDGGNGGASESERGRGKKRSMRGGGGGGGEGSGVGGVMQAQSVTEIERFHEQDREREGSTRREAESPSSAGRREETRGKRTREVEGEWEEGGKMMEPRNRLRRTAFHPRCVQQTRL